MFRQRWRCWQISLLATALLTIFPIPAFARLFRNSYISFQLPPSWNCKPNSTDWTCTNKYSTAAKEAIIVFAAKEAGPADTLQNYKAHLSVAKTLPNPSGGTTTSSVLEVQQRMINDQPWIDGMQLSSEVKGYYTRYLATTKNHVAILVTFTADKEDYTRYSADFINAIGSLRVVAAKNILSSAPQMISTSGNEVIGAPINPEPISGPTNVPPVPSANGNHRNLATMLFGLALILAVAGIYLWRKKRK